MFKTCLDNSECVGDSKQQSHENVYSMAMTVTIAVILVVAIWQHGCSYMPILLYSYIAIWLCDYIAI